jgi:PPK2 family polyphosphate:nucleotide phosphotransferase
MKRYLVKPGSHLKLSDYDPDETSEFSGDKEAASNKLNELTGKLEVLQELLYAEHKHNVLIVLQGTDTSGKDGVIRHVFEGVNPQGVRVASFKVPTPEELDRDYLWRVHKQAPGKGEMVIFNRSHYEDVLVVRVHGWITQDECKRRYQQINDFERLLAEEGATILKFFLYIDKEEQKKRLLDRLEDPTKQWKFNSGDLKERDLWDKYARAYEDALSHTSTPSAPWYIVPANRKWYRNLVIASVMVETLEGLDMHYPEPKEDLSQISIT